MGELGGFIKVHRVGFDKRDPDERVRDYKQYFHTQTEEELQRQGARCMDCGVPFCHEGCPLGNPIPDWNDLVYRGDWEAQLHRFVKVMPHDYKRALLELAEEKVPA